ncbi:MAG: hypothetical protein ACMXYD_02855 [Candidatus Woesearchaeota archaeon]
MEFDISRREAKQAAFSTDVLDAAYNFTKLAHKELGDLLRAAILFGSATHKENPGDIDILLIIDDIQIAFTQEMQAAYEVITRNCVSSVSDKLHVTTLRFSNFWEYVRTADPIITTVLRDGKPLLDTGFFAPLQLLLQQGRIRPSHEAIWAYYAKAPQSLINSKWKMLLAVIDLYWAAIDAAHAALMYSGVVPQTPEHVAGLLEEHLVRKGLLEQHYPAVLEKLYRLQKDIYARRVEVLSGARIDELYAETDGFVKRLRKIIE